MQWGIKLNRINYEKWSGDKLKRTKGKWGDGIKGMLDIETAIEIIGRRYVFKGSSLDTPGIRIPCIGEKCTFSSYP